MQQAREAATSKRRNSNSCRRDGKCAGWEARRDLGRVGKGLAQSRCSANSSCWFERYKPRKLLAPCFPLLANGMLCAFEGRPGLFDTPEFI